MRCRPFTIPAADPITTACDGCDWTEEHEDINAAHRAVKARARFHDEQQEVA
jgi:hypothetical protein